MLTVHCSICKEPQKNRSGSVLVAVRPGTTLAYIPVHAMESMVTSQICRHDLLLPRFPLPNNSRISCHCQTSYSPGAHHERHGSLSIGNRQRLCPCSPHFVCAGQGGSEGLHHVLSHSEKTTRSPVISRVPYGRHKVMGWHQAD